MEIFSDIICCIIINFFKSVNNINVILEFNNVNIKDFEVASYHLKYIMLSSGRKFMSEANRIFPTHWDHAKLCFEDKFTTDPNTLEAFRTYWILFRVRNTTVTVVLSLRYVTIANLPYLVKLSA
jgi:hypothetical protein